jgi:hypothetical protein
MQSSYTMKSILNRSIRTLIVMSVGFLPILGAVDLAHAEQSTDQGRYEAHFRRGVSLFRGREYEAALAEFVEAYRLRGHFAILLNIAYCYQEMNRPVEALDHFERYLRDGGSRVQRARRLEIEGEIRELRALIVDVDVRVNIDGAVITVNGREVGTSPLDSPLALPAGAEHRIEARLTGFRAAVREITLAQGAEPPVVELELSRLQVSERIQVRSTPPGAEVLINGERVGTSPWSDQLETGTYSLELRLDGYVSQQREVAVVAGEPRLVEVTFAAPGRLSLLSNVDDAAVLIDGEEAATTPLEAPIALTPGGHRVRLEREGYQPWVHDLVIESDQRVVADVTLADTEGGLAPGLFWASLGVAAATGIGALVTGILTLDQQGDVDQFLEDVRAGEELGTFAELDRRRREMQDTGTTLAITTDVLWISSAVFAATTLVLGFFTRFGPRESDAEIEITAASLTGGAMIAVSGRFAQ